MSKNVLITIMAVVLAGVLAGGGVYVWQHNDDDNVETSSQETSLQTPSGSDEAVSQLNDQNSSEEPTQSDEDLIRIAISEKYNKDPEETSLEINENDGEYASGVVRFGEEVSGGWWLAAMVDGDWVIVADGNGTVMCDDIAAYNFPTSMVPECWDESTQTLVTR